MQKYLFLHSKEDGIQYVVLKVRYLKVTAFRMARWLSLLERRPVTAEVEGSNPFRVAACEYPSTQNASKIYKMGS